MVSNKQIWEKFIKREYFKTFELSSLSEHVDYGLHHGSSLHIVGLLLGDLGVQT
jgi:hypothetical protein